MWDIERVITCGPKYENDKRNFPALGRFGLSNIKYYALSNKSSGSLIQIAPLAEDNALLVFSKNGSAENYMVTAAKVLREQLGELGLCRLRQFLLEKKWTLRGEMVTVNIEETEDSKASITAHACRPLKDHIVFHGGSQQDGSMLTYLHLLYMRSEIMAVSSPDCSGIFIPETMVFHVPEGVEDPMQALRAAHSEANNTFLEPAMDNPTFQQDPEQYDQLRNLFQSHGTLVDHVESYSFAEYDSPTIFEGYIVDIITECRMGKGMIYEHLQEYIDIVQEKHDNNEKAQQYLRERLGACTTLTDTVLEPVVMAQKYSRPVVSISLPASVEEAIAFSASSAAAAGGVKGVVGSFVRLQQNATGALAAWLQHMTDFVKSPEARAQGVKEDWIKVKQVVSTDTNRLLCIVHCTNDAVFSAYDTFMWHYFKEYDTLKFPQLGRGFVLLLTQEPSRALSAFTFERVHLTKMKLVNYTFRTMLLRSWLSQLSKSGDSINKSALKEGPLHLMRRTHTFLRRWGVSAAAAHNQGSRLAYLFYSYVITHSHLTMGRDDHIVILDSIFSSGGVSLAIEPILKCCDPGSDTLASSHVTAIRLFSGKSELYADAIRKANEAAPDEHTTASLKELIQNNNNGQETMWLIAAAAYGQKKETIDPLLQIFNTTSTAPAKPIFAQASQLFLKEHTWVSGQNGVQNLILKSKAYHLLFEEWAIKNANPGALRPVELVFFGAPSGSGKSTAAKHLHELLSQQVHTTGRVVLLEADKLLKAANITQSATGHFRSGTDFLISELASLLNDEDDYVTCAIIDRCTIHEFESFAKKLNDTTFRHSFRCVYLLPKTTYSGTMQGNIDWTMPCGGLREMAISACSVLLRNSNEHILGGDIKAATKAVGNFFFSRLQLDTTLPEAFVNGFEITGADIVYGHYEATNAEVTPSIFIKQLTSFILGLAITQSLLPDAPFYSKNILPKVKEYNAALAKAKAPNQKPADQLKSVKEVETLAELLIANPDTDLYFSTKCETAVAKAARDGLHELKPYFVTKAAQMAYAPPCVDQVFLDDQNPTLLQHARNFLSSIRLPPQQVAQNMLEAGWALPSSSSAPKTLAVAPLLEASVDNITTAPCFPSYFQFKPLQYPDALCGVAKEANVPVRTATHTLHITAGMVSCMAPSSVPTFFDDIYKAMMRCITESLDVITATHLQKAAYASAVMMENGFHMTLLSGVEDKYSVDLAENGAHISLEMYDIAPPMHIICRLCPFIPSA